MKKTVFVFTALLVSLAFCQPKPAANGIAMQPRPQIKIGKTIGTLRQGSVEIVTEEKPIPLIAYASKELKATLEKILGGTVLIVTAPSEGKTSFILGENKWSKEAGLAPDRTIRDSFIIKNTKDRIYILGVDQATPRFPAHGLEFFTERGTLFGVYEWLERFAGVRYYFTGELGEIYPRKNEIAYPQADIFIFPSFVNRSNSILGTMPGTTQKCENKYRNFLGLHWRTETKMVQHCHGLRCLGLTERFAEKHPEYMALMADGTRHSLKTFRPHYCYSSGIREEIYQDIASFFKGEPATKRGILYNGKQQWNIKAYREGTFDMMPDDSFRGCQCEECKKHWINDVNYASDYIWEFVAECANRLTKEGLNGTLNMMAYYPYRKVPSVELPRNVSVKLAELGPWGKNNPEGQKKDKEEIVAWAKKVAPNKLRLWVYLCKELCFNDVPSPTPLATGEYFKEMSPYIEGAFVEAETDRCINNYLPLYLFNKVAWNPDLDVKEAIAEHHRLMFGAGAEQMGAIFSRLEELWLNKIAGRVVFTNVGPVVSPPSDHELWMEIYSEQELRSLQANFDAAEANAKGDAMSMARIKLFRSEWLEPLEKRRKTFMTNMLAREDLYMTPDFPGVMGLFKANSKVKSTFLRNEVRFTRSEGKLTFVFDCEEPELDKAIAPKREKDDVNIWKDSSVELFLNPSGDRKNCYQIMVGLSGSVTDIRFALEGQKRVLNEIEWDSGAETKIERLDKAFRITVAIPEKNIGTIQAGGFPANFTRNRNIEAVNALPDNYAWGAPIIKSYSDVENFGMLLFEAPKTANLVRNPDFLMPDGEKGKSHGAWYGIHPSRFTEGKRHEIDHTEFFTGGQSLKLVTDGSSGISNMQVIKGIKPNTRYRLSFYVKLKDVRQLKKGGGFYMQHHFTTKQQCPPVRLYGNIPWTRFVCEIKTGSQIIGQPFLNFSSNSASGTAWLDHVELIEL